MKAELFTERFPERSIAAIVTVSSKTMPTPNERTVPSPERDEELEKFIQKRFDLNCVDVPDDDWNHYMVREEDFKRAAIDIAAFSARRARKKLLKYVCEQIGLMARLRESMNGKGDPGITILELVKEHFEELKSTTN